MRRAQAAEQAQRAAQGQEKDACPGVEWPASGLVMQIAQQFGTDQRSLTASGDHHCIVLASGGVAMADDVTRERSTGREMARLRAVVQRAFAQPVISIPRDAENRPDPDEPPAQAMTVLACLPKGMACAGQLGDRRQPTASAPDRSPAKSFVRGRVSSPAREIIFPVRVL
mgnify:FL=1